MNKLFIGRPKVTQKMIIVEAIEKCIKTIDHSSINDKNQNEITRQEYKNICRNWGKNLLINEDRQIQIGLENKMHIPHIIIELENSISLVAKNKERLNGK